MIGRWKQQVTLLVQMAGMTLDWKEYNDEKITLAMKERILERAMFASILIMSFIAHLAS